MSDDRTPEEAALRLYHVGTGASVELEPWQQAIVDRHFRRKPDGILIAASPAEQAHFAELRRRSYALAIARGHVRR